MTHLFMKFNHGNDNRVIFQLEHSVCARIPMNTIEKKKKKKKSRILFRINFDSVEINIMY